MLRRRLLVGSPGRARVPIRCHSSAIWPRWRTAVRWIPWSPRSAPVASFSAKACLFDQCGKGHAWLNQGDTIYALSTAQGRAGIAVIRISGSACQEIYHALCPGKALPKPRYATVRTLLDPASRGPAADANAVAEAEVLDSQALVLYFPSPKTVTGEDVLELHVHGGPAIVRAVLAAIPRSPSHSRIRYAEPGEFTKRALVNDRLDLVQVEALGDSLAAETEQQRRVAVRGNSGSLGRTYEAWRQQLLLARGEIEALIDFSEDQHFDESQPELLASVSRQIAAMLHSIHLHEQGGLRSELLRSGIRIALVGPPNVGKSSLMNLIVGREASIVSGEAGTTRDIVEASLDIRGYLCSFADTAGFRSDTAGYCHENDSSQADDSIGIVEKEGIRRARRKAQEAHVVVVVASVEHGPTGPFIRYDGETVKLASEAPSCLVVVNKRDSVDADVLDGLLGRFKKVLGEMSAKMRCIEVLAISCKEAQTGSARSKDPGGIHGAVESLRARFSAMTEMQGDEQELLGVTRRQAEMLAKCRQHLEDFAQEARPGDDGVEGDSVVAAEYLRYAADCLARITGKGEAGDVEEVLGVVFEKFCVGK